MKKNKMSLENGTLWQKALDRTERALRIGALFPISTSSTFVHDNGVDFLVRIVSSLARKQEAKKSAGGENAGALEKRPNPFLPYEDDMFVADISDTHVCLLNKFNVIDHHLLIVTRAFEDQERLLTLKDFEAIWTCMAEFEGLAFYNGGEVAGASQKHKHLQIIPLPMVKNGLQVPVEPLFASARFENGLGVVPGFPFIHSYARLSPDLISQGLRAPEILLRLYRDMLQAVGLNGIDESERSVQSGPYNLLFTREWMLVVPRSEEFFGPISINALGFAGALLVQDEAQMRMLAGSGAMAVLKHTAIAE